MASCMLFNETKNTCLAFSSIGTYLFGYFSERVQRGLVLLTLVVTVPMAPNFSNAKAMVVCASTPVSGVLSIVPLNLGATRSLAGSW